MAHPVSGYLQTLSADGNTSWVTVIGRAKVSIYNDFGTGTAKIQEQDPAGTAVDVETATGFTTAQTETLDFPTGSVNKIRVNLAGATNPDLQVWIQGEDRSGHVANT